MNRTITFNELRKIKDSLPTGSMHRIADELNLSVETVRNFFGGQRWKECRNSSGTGTGWGTCYAGRYNRIR